MNHFLFKRPVVVCATFLVLGILAFRVMHLSVVTVLLAAVVIFCAGMFFQGHSDRFRQMLFLLFCLCFLLTGYSRISHKTEEFYHARLPDYTSVLINGTVVKMERHKQTMYLYLSGVTVEKQNVSERETRKFRYLSESGQVYCSSFLLLVPEKTFTAAGVRTGNQIQAEGSFLALKQARNHGNFDEKKYYHSLGIAGKAKAKKLSILDSRYKVLPQALFEIKQNLIDAITQSAGKENAAVFLAIVTGDRTQLDDETKTLFQESGIAHILAISGLHISLIGLTFFRLLRKRLSFFPSAFLSFVVLVLFCILSGSSISAIRAVMMFFISLIAAGVGKTYDLLTSLSVCGMILLISEPYYLFNTGFQLSFGAILAVAVVGKRLQGFFSRKHRIEQTLLVSLSISLVTLPVIANTYYQIPVYAVLLNLIVIPLLSFVLGSGILSGLAGLISLVFGRFFLGLGMYVLFFIEGAAKVMLQFPGSILTTGAISTARIICYYGILAAVCLLSYIRTEQRRGKRWKFLSHFKTIMPGICKGSIVRRAVSLLLIMGLLAGGVWILTFRPDRDSLKIVMLDVDQGESILIKNTTGTTWLIDAGSTGCDQVWKYRIESALKYYGVDQIDYVILTHPDADHVNGIIEAIADRHKGQVRFRKILIPFIADSETENEIQSTAIKNGIAYENLHQGMGFQDGELSLRILHPAADFRSTDTNAYSAVMELRYGAFSALFTGDLGEEEERKLLQSGQLAHFDLLKVAHHGSRNSSCEAFLAEVSPRYAVVSAGVNNSYGHPHTETLKRLAAGNTRVFVTSKHGEILFNIDKKGWTVSTMF